MMNIKWKEYFMPIKHSTQNKDSPKNSLCRLGKKLIILYLGIKMTILNYQKIWTIYKCNKYKLEIETIMFIISLMKKWCKFQNKYNRYNKRLMWSIAKNRDLKNS